MNEIEPGSLLLLEETDNECTLLTDVLRVLRPFDVHARQREFFDIAYDGSRAWPSPKDFEEWLVKERLVESAGSALYHLGSDGAVDEISAGPHEYKISPGGLVTFSESVGDVYLVEAVVIARESFVVEAAIEDFLSAETSATSRWHGPRGFVAWLIERGIVERAEVTRRTVGSRSLLAITS